jgi:DNA polymerase I-like protein with 3'-5' exonuclease and polymerase domains
MGRYRPLPEINHSKPMMRGHAERAAINTPIQVPYRNGSREAKTVYYAWLADTHARVSCVVCGAWVI